MATTLKAHLLKCYVESLDYYVRDLKAMSHELLAHSPGGAARSAYDFTFEVVVVQKRIAARLRGDDPGPYAGGEAWIMAPAEFQNPETALSEMLSSGEAIRLAFEAIPESDLEREIPIPSGSVTPLSLMDLASGHLNYHDAQMNYLQAMEGDGAVHWKD
jgi:hypothetical protein